MCRSIAVLATVATAAGLSLSVPGIAQASVCTTSAAKGACGPYKYPKIDGNTAEPTVGNNVWNRITGWHQTMHSTSPGDWNVTANMPAGNTAVVSFPNTGATYNEQPISKFSAIYSSFSEKMPHNSQTSGWAAYHLWFNNWADEVMIQHDFSKNGPCTPVVTHTFDGSHSVPKQRWHLCIFGSERVWKLAGGSSPEGTKNEPSGSVNIESMLTWMEGHGYLPKNSTITALSYGFEICSTGARNEQFSVSSFSITATRTSTTAANARRAVRAS